MCAATLCAFSPLSASTGNFFPASLELASCSASPLPPLRLLLDAVRQTSPRRMRPSCWMVFSHLRLRLRPSCRMVCSHPRFDPKEIRSETIVHLLRRFERPFKETVMHTYNLWKEGDGNQRLEFVVRDYLEVFREICRDRQFKGQFDLTSS